MNYSLEFITNELGDKEVILWKSANIVEIFSFYEFQELINKFIIGKKKFEETPLLKEFLEKKKSL